MDKVLKVYLSDQYVGDLIERDGQSLRFVYNSSNVPAISLAMPTSNQIYYHKQTFSFFENLLPEGDILSQIAKIKGVSANNPFSLLSVIGEDCAGAISLHVNELKTNKDVPKLISNQKLTEIVSKSSKTRLAYYASTRLSLAGAQDKITIIYQDGNYYVPTFEFPSTHIIKFHNEFFPNILLNELYCTNLAASLNIPTSEMIIDYRNKVPFLLIRRFDRTNKQTKTVRVHQEDFCQLLSIKSKNKYQKEGGPSFLDSVNVINKYSKMKARDIMLFAKILVYNYLIGNCDYHSKNLSLLHSAHCLTPFYDLVSTISYPSLTKEMAMAINKKYEISQITKDDIIAEFDRWAIKGRQMLALIVNDFKNIIEKANSLKTDKEYDSASPTIDKIINFIKIQYNKLQ